MRPENVLMGKRIAAAREHRGWSKADLARKAGVAPSYVTRVEQGKFDRPSIDLIGAIARALNVGVSDLMGKGVEVADAADLRAALLARGYQPSETPVVDAMVTKLLELSPHQRRQVLELMDHAIGLVPHPDDRAH